MVNGGCSYKTSQENAKVKPFFSCIMLTYGRVAHAEESIQCFLDQDFKGARELIVFNSFLPQRLKGDFPNVKIVNAESRPPNLGRCRNAAISHASGNIIIVWDDDNIFASNHLSNYAQHFTDSTDWIWLSQNWYMEGWVLKGIVKGACDALAFKMSAFDAVGKYKDMNSGEDRDIISRISSRPGKIITLQPEEVSLVYHWGNSCYHTSGLGNDKSGQKSAHDRIHEFTMQGVRSGKIPTGEILLKPATRHNYTGMIREFFGKKEVIAPDATCILQIGKTGDLINILPVAKHYADKQGSPIHVVTSREFVSVLDGVSYVKPFVIDCTVHELNRAIRYASQTFAHVIKTQIYGHSYVQERQCASWPQESWREAGCLDHFHDPEWKLIFDRRDATREKSLCAKVFRTNKPKLITNFTSAQTVPFPSGQAVLAAVSREFSGTYEVVDVGRIRAERIYDLLGLYEKAEVICSIDTATMHLAAAVDVPLVALVNPNGWLGPQLRYNCAARIPYPQANLKTICDAIKAAPECMGIP